MNSILHKVQLYLDKVSREPVKVSDKLVEFKVVNIIWYVS